MREIKFRQYVWQGSDKTGPGDMVEWEDLLAEEGESLSATFSEKFSNASELMQYTGLKTDTGKDVYEGDIVVIPNLIGRIHNHVDTVVFKNGAFILERCKDILVCQELMDEGVSVIGNIYENPELMGGENERD